MIHRQLVCAACASLAIIGVPTAYTSRVEGAPVKDPAVKTGDVIVVLLNPGNHPTKPLPPLGSAGAGGVTAEGRRMAGSVVGPWEVDSSLVKGFIPLGTVVWK